MSTTTYTLREQIHDDLLDDLLSARGVLPKDTPFFLDPSYERDSHDPFLLPDMEVAVGRIVAAKNNSEHICVWSDYDCDGIPGGVMLTDFLREFGLTVTHYIPHRHKEGYGLNKGGIDQLFEQGVTLIITIDLGTTEQDNIVYAKEKGIEVIVTDHHIVQALPSENVIEQNGLVEPEEATRGPFVRKHSHPALALINPKRPDSLYPFDGLCGAGVAWKLIQALLQKHRPSTFTEGREKWYLDLVGIATLCDMVPLVGENRMLASFGLRVMRRDRRPGLSSLLKLLRIKPTDLTEDDVGFMIGPRINAASRMDNPHVAARMLAATGIEEANEFARTLNKINDERKGVVASIVKEVNKRLLTIDVSASPLIVMGNPNWRPGVLGLVASSLVQTHQKTVFLWGREGGEVLRGSCRSDGVVNVVELMQLAADSFEHFGGHHASGGFSVHDDKVHELSSNLNDAYAKTSSPGESQKVVVVDRQSTLAELPHALKNLNVLAPFGVGNSRPLFIFKSTVVTNVRTFGKASDHLELALEQGGVHAAGVAFFSTPTSFQKNIQKGERVDVVGHIERDWRGQPRIRIVELL